MGAKRRDNKGRVLHNGESQRADGKYMFRYIDSSDKRRTIYSWKLVSTDKLKEGQRDSLSLREQEKIVLRDVDDGIKTSSADKISIDDLFNKFMDIRKDLKENSRRNYDDLYQKHIAPVLGKTAIGKIKSSTLQKLYYSLSVESHLATSTVLKIQVILSYLFDIAVDDNLVRLNITNRAFKNFSKTADFTKNSKDPLTVEQQEAFIKYVYRSPLYHRLGNLFTVLLGSGLRIGEALGLTWKDCDFEKGFIYVSHTLLYRPGYGQGCHYMITTPKTPAGNRSIPMLDEVKKALLRERGKKKPKGKPFSVDGYSGFVFLNGNYRPFSPGYIYEAMQGIITAFNKEEYMNALEEERPPQFLPKFSAHVLRHTFCTRLCEKEVNLKVLQEVMGHQNIRTTMETYARALDEKKQEVFRALEGDFRLS